MNFGFDIFAAGTTPVHRCDARVKLLLLVAFTVAVCAVGSWWVLGALAAAAAAVLVVARLNPMRLAAALAPVLLLAGFTFLVGALGAGTVQGAAGAAFAACRMVVLVAGSFAVCFTTQATDLLEALRWAMAPLRALRVPVDDVATTLSLAIRFVPVVAEELQRIRMAQAARGGSANTVPFARRLRLWGATFTALFVGLFRRADALSAAMDARAYGAARMRTRLPRR